MRRTRMMWLALVLSVLAFGALGLVACGGGDEDTTTEPKVSADTTTQATVPHGPATEAKRTATEAKLSREQVQELRREANRWASLFAVRDCNKYMGQPICERLACERHGVPIENCTPVSEATKESFAEATVEEIKKSKRIVVGRFNRPVYEAAVKFSNGVVVVFNGLAPGAPEPPDGSCAGSGGSCSWNIDETTAASEIETGREELAADNKACGLPAVAVISDHVPPFRLAVVEGDASCGVARRVMRDWAADRDAGSWSCIGPESQVVCKQGPGNTITFHF